MQSSPPRARARKPTLEMLPAGTRLGRYELIRRFATGGMAELYLARSGGSATSLGGFEKILALKRILPQYAAQEDFVRMFLDEARLTATIQHANVAQVYDIGQCDDGLFFTMEYVHGADLRTVLHTLARRAQTMPLADALTIAIGAAAGLHAAHERTATDGTPLGIIHRDVTPSNVLVSFDGCVKLIDFGIAKAERRTTETRAGTLKGKIAYMSPEQCLGDPLDRRSDIFSLGIVLFEASTGTRLFPGDNEYAALRQIVDQDAPLPSGRRPDYPPELEQIVMRALRRNPAERYPTAQALQIDLEEFARSRGMATSTAHLGAFMRALLPERASEPLLDDPLRLPLPPPPPILAVVPSGTGENKAIGAALETAAGRAVPNLADELEPSISIAASDPDLSAASAQSAVSAVSAELALLRRQRSSHLFIAVGAAALISAFIAVFVAMTITRKPAGAPAPAPAPAPTPAPALAPPAATAPAPAAFTVDRPPPPVASDPPPATRAPSPPPSASPPATKAVKKSRPKADKSSRRWNPDSALPPM